MALEWDDAYSMGVEALDAQHRQLIRRLRRLGEAIGAERPVETGQELRALQRFVSDHFADEERWMEQEGYPGAAEHERAHRAGLELLDTAARVHREGGLGPRFVEVIERAARWLDVHLRTDDLRLGRFNAARKNLRQLASGPGGADQLTPVPRGAIDAVAAPGRRDWRERAPEDQ